MKNFKPIHRHRLNDPRDIPKSPALSGLRHRRDLDQPGDPRVPLQGTILP